MRGFLCALLMALPCACSDSSPADPAQKTADAGSDFSRQQPGQHSAAEVGQRLPQLTVLREATQLRCEVTCGLPAELRWAELSRPEAAPQRLDKPPPVFHLPTNTHGPILIRLGYQNGEIWRDSFTL